MIATILIAQVIGNTCPDWVWEWLCIMVQQDTLAIVFASGLVVAAVTKIRGWREQ